MDAVFFGRSCGDGVGKTNRTMGLCPELYTIIYHGQKYNNNNIIYNVMQMQTEILYCIIYRGLGVYIMVAESEKKTKTEHPLNRIGPARYLKYIYLLSYLDK